MEYVICLQSTDSDSTVGYCYCYAHREEKSWRALRGEILHLGFSESLDQLEYRDPTQGQIQPEVEGGPAKRVPKMKWKVIEHFFLSNIALIYIFPPRSDQNN